MMNNINLVGRISSEFSVKEFEHGKVAHFTVADNDGWNGKETVSYFFNADIRNTALVDRAVKVLSKGRLIWLNGHLVTRTYEKDGKKNTVVSIVLNDFKLINTGTSNKKTDEAEEFEG